MKQMRPYRTLGGGLCPPSETSPQDSLRRQSRRSEVEHSHVADEKSSPDPVGSSTAERWVFRFERGLCPRNRFLGEVSEGAAEAPSDETSQMRPYHRSSPWYQGMVSRATWRIRKSSTRPSRPIRTMPSRM